MRNPLLLLVPTVALVAAWSSSASAAEPVLLRHLPPGQASVDEALVIEARIERAWQETLELRYRTGASDAPGAWSRVAFARREGGEYLATIPALAVRPPGLDYFIVGVTPDGQERAHFASSVLPHHVDVVDAPEVILEREELDRLRGRRARVRTSFEVVDFGERTIERADGASYAVKDQFYRLDVDFTYRLLKMPLRALRFGFTRLLGETALPTGEVSCDPCGVDSGFRAGGWFELRFRLSSSVDLDTRGLVQATAGGFGFGGRGELRMGGEDGSHVAFGVEAITEIGSSVFFRLGWDTVPGLPMSATVELTDYPSALRPTGIRLVYDIAHPFENGLRVGGRVGYQARDKELGGPSAGLYASLDF